MSSDVPTAQRRVRFSIWQLFVVICVCGLIAGLLQSYRQTRQIRLMREREGILIDQMRALQDENRQLLLQVNQRAEEALAVEGADAISAFLGNLSNKDED